MMTNFKPLTFAITLVVPLGISTTAIASPAISGGVWFNYSYAGDSDRDDETFGSIGDEAIILYVDDQLEETPWSYSAEARYGPGSFTDRANNTSGDDFSIHKAWVGYEFADEGSLKVGKSQVPFGWKSVNFWPGDALLGGYGDQMDVGLKYTSALDKFDYNLAYYHADDWGKTSTDTLDDNGHWGSSDTYRKVQTVVADAAMNIAPNQQIGASIQAGRLQDLTGIDPDNPVDGDHSAVAVYYKGQFDALGVKGLYVSTERSLPDDYALSVGLDDISNDRALLELSYAKGDYLFYLDSSFAFPDTDENSASTVAAFTPGVSYNYGPGWIYLEYLSQDVGIDRNGMVTEGNFDAFYATIDFYF